MRLRHLLPVILSTLSFSMTLSAAEPRVTHSDTSVQRSGEVTYDGGIVTVDRVYDLSRKSVAIRITMVDKRGGPAMRATLTQHAALAFAKALGATLKRQDAIADTEVIGDAEDVVTAGDMEAGVIMASDSTRPDGIIRIGAATARMRLEQSSQLASIIREASLVRLKA